MLLPRDMMERRILEIDSDQLRRLLAEPATDVVILTRRRWVDARGRSASAGWQVLENRGVGDKDVVAIGSAPRGDSHSPPRR